jgi:Uma2 family endonuclease
MLSIQNKMMLDTLTQPISPPITLEQFLLQPETKPASEFINGIITQKTRQQGEHSSIQGELTSTVNGVFKKARIAWAFPELRCTFGDRSIVADIAVFTWEHIPTNPDGTIANTFNQPPDWAIEILSPNQSVNRVVVNILHCLNHGSQMGWLIDPAERLVIIYQPNQQPIAITLADQMLIFPSFASTLQLSLGQLFDCLQVN